MKKLVLKKVVSILLSAILMLSMSSGVFAYHEEDVLDDVEIVPAERYINPIVASTNGSFSGYNNCTHVGSDTNSFKVTVTGSTGWSAGLTIKTESNSSSSIAVITVKRPSGSNIIYEATFSGNDERQFEYYFPTSGTYTIEYCNYVPSGCYLTMHCWIYG